MAIVAEQLKLLITRELWREDEPAFTVTIGAPKATFSAVLDSAWDLYESQHAIGTRLGYLYVKRHMVSWLQQSIWMQRNTRAMDRYDYASDLRKGLESIYKQLTTEITDATVQATGELLGGEVLIGELIAARTGVTAGSAGIVLAQQAALGRLGGGAGDPNSAVYQGDPSLAPTYGTEI